MIVLPSRISPDTMPRSAASPYVICPLTDVDGIVAAADIPKKTLADYRKRGLSVVQA